MLDNDVFVNVLYMCFFFIISFKLLKKIIIVFIFFGRVNFYLFILVMFFKVIGGLELLI